MANTVYPSAKQAFLSAGVNIPSDTVKVLLIDATITYNASHANLSDISNAAGARVATSGALGGKTVTSGVFNATNPTINSVTGNTIKGFIVFKDTGTESTSTLLSFHDTQSDGTTAISLAPNGGNITVQFDTGANKIFRLA